jgi:hypothetical protein
MPNKPMNKRSRRRERDRASSTASAAPTAETVGAAVVTGLLNAITFGALEG